MKIWCPWGSSGWATCWQTRGRSGYRSGEFAGRATELESSLAGMVGFAATSGAVGFVATTEPAHPDAIRTVTMAVVDIVDLVPAP
jgi:hypothetical protein